ncbi:GFA family protein [Undibacterium sp. LX40W]|uniref:GFA family protein n=1 Tax=Undibacterium nitidum TaxID=2762298 RepID=A0A923HN86_9BURK|nr:MULTISPECIES: GFA family protein [Undibacterium]MBC3880793.1 GFA family protein [Undibacterium nitidum]MBC3890474.1 GFA family protein [Undibacterium sp. LX40W]
MLHKGSCHCGAVQFEVEAADEVEVEDCNCSICQMSGFLHLIVPLRHFRLMQGQDHLQSYRFNTGTAEHLFCKTCGVKPFYVPRSNPDGMDVNLRCLQTRPKQVTIVKFDGQNWEQVGPQLREKSQ